VCVRACARVCVCVCVCARARVCVCLCTAHASLGAQRGVVFVVAVCTERYIV
jgi:hypothetical protein